MVRFLQSIAGLLVAAAIVSAWNWQTLHGWRVRHDLHQIAKRVRQADAPLNQKERILDQIDGIRSRARYGHLPSLLSWWEVVDAVNDLSTDGIRDDEPQLIHREFRRLVAEIDETESQ